MVSYFFNHSCASIVLVNNVNYVWFVGKHKQMDIWRIKNLLSFQSWKHLSESPHIFNPATYKTICWYRTTLKVSLSLTNNDNRKVYREFKATRSQILSAPHTLYTMTLQWRHNGHDSVSNHQPHDCLLNHLFRRISKKTSKLRVTGLRAGNSPGTGEFPA